jgi:DNA-directed RNA polymerase specialized sigma24 family protein
VVFVLHHVEELSLPEVAEICGHSLMTAKRRLGAARRRFEAMIRSRPELIERLRSAKGKS